VNADDENPKLGHGEALGLLAKHSVILTIALLVVFALAVVLHLLAKGMVKWEWIEQGSLLELSLLFARTLLLIVDLALFTTLVLVFAWRVFKKIIKSRS